MIICKYKDGSSIRRYKTKQHRLNAINILLKMGYHCQIVASDNYYSMKVFDSKSYFYKNIINTYTTGSPIYIVSRLKGVTFVPRRPL